MNIKIINPIQRPDWDELLLTSQKTTFFHTSTRAKVLSESYNYTPIYFTEIENKKLLILIPVMEIRSVITGKRGVSLPFNDLCEPIALNGDRFKQVVEKIINYGKVAKWKYIKFKGSKETF